MNAKAPERQVQLAINLATKQVRIVILTHGHPVPSAAVAMTVEQAAAGCRTGSGPGQLDRAARRDEGRRRVGGGGDIDLAR